MERRDFLRIAPVAGAAGFVSPSAMFAAIPKDGSDRQYWVSLLTKICGPVLQNLSKGQLKQNMPLEKPKNYAKKVEEVTYLEALGRTLAGLSAWVSLPLDTTAEGKLRAQYAEMARASIRNIVDPSSPDFTHFEVEGDPQLLVDAAFLAHGMLRAPQQLWEPLPAETKKQVVTAFRNLQWIRPGESNWLLFAAMLEAFFLYVGEEWDPMRVDYAVSKHQDWYMGDGWYGDGPTFHFDYYNGYVIQPMLVDILKVLWEKGKGRKEAYEMALKRMQRFSVIQERLISPEGTYPPIGRSIIYRVGAFQPLAQLAWQEQLPEELSPAQVRSALTAVMKNQFEAAGTFDKNGWLQLGFNGHQPSAADAYISTGSLYLCTVGFLPLGLPASAPFWKDPSAAWTAKKAWSGQPFEVDHAVSY